MGNAASATLIVFMGGSIARGSGPSPGWGCASRLYFLDELLTLVVHGGAGNQRPDIEGAARAGVSRALAIGWAVLEAGGTSRDACEPAVVLLEDDPVFDAGVGAHLNRDGIAQLDAIIMDGRSLQSEAIGAVERIRNPIHLARLVLEKGEHSLLVGAGAEQFAVETGLRLCDPTS